MKPLCKKVVVVEGKYDKARVESCLDAVVVTTDGFALFHNEEKRALLRRLAETQGLVLFCDPDGGGKVIRSHLHTITGKDGVIDLYLPPVAGKEKRKAVPSKEGLLGVEGTPCDEIVDLFEKAGLLEPEGAPPRAVRYEKIDLYKLGYVGCADSRQKREAFARENRLPQNLSSGDFLDAVNLLGLNL